MKSASSIIICDFNSDLQKKMNHIQFRKIEKDQSGNLPMIIGASKKALSKLIRYVLILYFLISDTIICDFMYN